MAQFQVQGPEASQSSRIAFGAILDDVEYQFVLQWLDRRQFWVLKIISARREVIIEGVRVVANSDMLQPYSDARLPPGQLVCHDTTNLQQDPGRDDWKERHILLYIQPVETPEAQVRVSDTEEVA